MTVAPASSIDAEGRRPGLVLRDPAARPGGLALLNPARMAARLWSLRGLVWQFSLRDIAARNRGTALGIVWLVVQPLLMLAVYTFVFAIVWSARWGVAPTENKVQFALTIFAGLALFEVFGSAVSQAPVLIVFNPNYVKKVVFPLEVLPFAAVLASLKLGLVSLVVLVAGQAVTGGGVSRTLYLLPVVLVPLVCLTAGLTLLLAALGVFLRDIKPIVSGLVLNVLFFMTPIFYPLERVPEWLREALAVNPLAVIVESGRRVLVFGQMPDLAGLGIVTLVSLVVLQAGYAFFVKSKRGFADVL